MQNKNNRAEIVFKWWHRLHSVQNLELLACNRNTTGTDSLGLFCLVTGAKRSLVNMEQHSIVFIYCTTLFVAPLFQSFTHNFSKLHCFFVCSVWKMCSGAQRSMRHFDNLTRDSFCCCCCCCRHDTNPDPERTRDFQGKSWRVCVLWPALPQCSANTKRPKGGNMQIDSEQINRSKYDNTLNVIKLVFFLAENQCKKYYI